MRDTIHTSNTTSRYGGESARIYLEVKLHKQTKYLKRLMFEMRCDTVLGLWRSARFECAY